MHVNSFAVLGHAVRQLPRAPVLGLLDLAALFRASVLDDGEQLLNLILRRRWPHDENQIVITLFHDDLFFFDPERIGVASNFFHACKMKKEFFLLFFRLFRKKSRKNSFYTFLPPLPGPLVSADCTSSSPRRVPDSGSSPRRLQPRRSFARRLPIPPFSSAAARILCGCSADDPARNPAAALQIPESRPN